MSWIERALAWLERLLSLVISIVVFVLVCKFDNSFQFITKHEFLSQISTISAALFAFLLAILTIIVQSESKSVLAIKADASYGRFISFNKKIVFSLIVITILSAGLDFAKHILVYLNKSLLFYIANFNFSLFIMATLDAVYFTILFYKLIMLDVKDKI